MHTSPRSLHQCIHDLLDPDGVQNRCNTALDQKLWTASTRCDLEMMMSIPAKSQRQGGNVHLKQTYQHEAMRAPEGHPRSTSQRWDTVRGDTLGCTNQNTRRGAQELGRRRPPGRIAPSSRRPQMYAQLRSSMARRHGKSAERHTRMCGRRSILRVDSTHNAR